MKELYVNHPFKCLCVFPYLSYSPVQSPTAYNKTAGMLDSIYHVTLNVLEITFWAFKTQDFTIMYATLL